MKTTMKAVILAGGSGTRLWPLSRKQKPKQFQKMTSDQTMLQETYARLAKHFSPDAIYISTNQDYVQEVSKELPEINKRNIIAEPLARNTAPGIALAAATIAQHHGDDAMIAVFPADHMIKNHAVLFQALDNAEAFLTQQPTYIITLGLAPTYPETGYGYIKKGMVLDKQKQIFAVDRFVEKPDAETAQKYIREASYYWNAGMFVFVAGAMLAKYQKYIPKTYECIKEIQEAMATDFATDVCRKQYEKTDAISVDYAIMENDSHVAVIPIADLGWSDVGSWAALKDALVGDGDEHLVQGEHIDFESTNLVVHGDTKPIVTIGLKDLVIVDTEHALLVCDRRHAQFVSSVVKSLQDTKHKKII